MNQLIAYFEYNEESFCISLIDKKKICFFKKNSNGELINSLSPLEYKMMKMVYNSLNVDSNKAIFIKKVTINSNLYNLFYDDNSDNYFWTSNDGRYNEMDNLFLNFKYNHQPDILYLGVSEGQKSGLSSKFYNKFVKIGKKVVSIAIAATLSLNLLAGCTLSEPNVTKTTEVTIEAIETTANAIIDTTDDNIKETTEEKREYNWDDIRQAIESNPNISEEEKKIITSLKFVFDSDHQYMDLDMIVERLGTLQILYGFTEEELKAGGTYTRSENIIRIAAPSFEEANIGVVVHEIGHSFQDPSGRNFLREWSNEKWTREVLYKLYNDNLIDKKLFLSSYGKELFDKGQLSFEEKPDFFLAMCADSFTYGYDTYIPLYCVLADLLPQETLIYCHYNPSHTGEIVDKLLEIEPLPEDRKLADEEIRKAYSVINLIDELREYDPTTGDYHYYYDLSQILSLLNHWYMKANGNSINDNPEYQIIFSRASQGGITGDYFKESYYNSNQFFRDKTLLEYGAYSFPYILLVKSYFGYSENPNNVLSFSFTALEINDELLTEFSENIEKNNTKNGR